MKACMWCRWWEHPETGDKGSCHRYAPSPSSVAKVGNGSRTVWPITNAFDGCGEHTPQTIGDVQDEHKRRPGTMIDMALEDQT